MYHRNLLRSVLLCLRSGGCTTQFRSRACACYQTTASKVNYPSRSYATADNATFTQFFRQPTKKWKMMVKNRLDEKIESEDVNACEQGLEAVPHSTLMSLLQNCSSVEEQINELCSRVSLTEEDVENRKKFAQNIKEILMPFFPDIEIHLFGSSINGFGFKGCDCDIAMDINGKFVNMDAESQAKKSGVRVEFPTVADIESGKASLESLNHLPPRLLLRFVRRVLYQHDDIDGKILLIKARHPILRFYSKKYNLFCDFSLGKNSSLRNTRTIRFIGYLDNRVMTMIKVLRYWAKHYGIIGDIDYFNSYAFSLLVVYFLQNTSPTVLPPLSHLVEKSDYLMTGKVGDDELMFNDLKKFTSSENTQTVGELLKEFFFYYMYFDFSQVLCPHSSSCVPKMKLMAGSEPFEFSTVAIQDPFNHNFNLSHAATGKSCQLFLNSVLEACRSYQKSELWIPNPRTKWGLSSLLDSSPSTLDQTRSTGTAHQHVIEIPLKTQRGVGNATDVCFEKAAKTVVDFFEYGLLFDCHMLTRGGYEPTSKQNEEAENCTKSIQTLKFTAIHNVFSGRSNWRRVTVPSDTVNKTLEREHLISLKVLETQGNEKSQATLFGFKCELLEFYRDSVPTLLVSLNFEKGNYKPAVVVFLNEYLPSFVQQSL